MWAMFQQAGLCQPPRAGAKNKNYLSKQLDAWERDPLALWRSLKARQQPRSQRPVDNSSEARARRAVQAAREGMASRARAALESEAMAPARVQTSDKLQTKHPDARHPLPAFSFGALPAAGRIEEDHVEEAVLSFNKGTSCARWACARSTSPTRSEARTARRCWGT